MLAATISEAIPPSVRIHTEYERFRTLSKTFLRLTFVYVASARYSKYICSMLAPLQLLA